MRLSIRVVAVAVFVMATTYFIAKVVAPSSLTLTDGFAAYYTSARLALAGQESALFYDNSWFRGRTIDFTGGQAADIYFANPPTTSLLLFPLAALSAERARVIWNAFNLLALLCALWLLIIATQMKMALALILSSITLISAPVAANFAHGQAYIILLLMYALALWALTRMRLSISGAAMGLAFILKASGGPVWLLMLARKQAKAVAAGLVAAMVLLVGSLPLVGVDTWRFYLTVEIPRFMQDPSGSVTAYQTLRSMMSHLFQFDATWNPRPLADAPMAGIALTVLFSLTALGSSLWLSNKMDETHAFAVFAALSVLLAPIAEEYHFVLMAVPAFVLVAKLAVDPEPFIILAALVALVLVGAPMNYKAPVLGQGAAALFAYPRLYGGLLLWGLLLMQTVPIRLPLARPAAAVSSTGASSLE